MGTFRFHPDFFRPNQIANVSDKETGGKSVFFGNWVGVVCIEKGKLSEIIQNRFQIWFWRSTNKLVGTAQPKHFSALHSNCQLCGSLSLELNGKIKSIMPLITMSSKHYSPVHFGVVIMFIVIEIRIRLPISLVDIIELISITMRNDVPETRSKSVSIAGLVVEAASNVGLDLVVLSLINVGWFVICPEEVRKSRFNNWFGCRSWQMARVSHQLKSLDKGDC